MGELGKSRLVFKLIRMLRKLKLWDTWNSGHGVTVAKIVDYMRRHTL